MSTLLAKSFKFVLLLVGYIFLPVTHWYHILRMQYGTEIRLFNRPCFILVLNRGQSYFFISTILTLHFLKGVNKHAEKSPWKCLVFFNKITWSSTAQLECGKLCLQAGLLHLFVFCSCKHQLSRKIFE